MVQILFVCKYPYEQNTCTSYVARQTSNILHGGHVLVNML